MKKFDIILLIISIVLFASLLVRFLSGIWIFKVLVGIVTLLVLFYWKLAPYKAQLSPKYSSWFTQIERVIKPIWGIFKNVPNIQLGQHLAMESAPFIICSILIIILVVL